ncbi:hypothetical protein C8Q78DRAFT_1083856 [Trametes maxima]|nr:hypothetical protein C8Q78DRAFT_1083856 [Trametes maxima]
MPPNVDRPDAPAFAPDASASAPDQNADRHSTVAYATRCMPPNVDRPNASAFAPDAPAFAPDAPAFAPDASAHDASAFAPVSAPDVSAFVPDTSASPAELKASTPLPGMPAPPEQAPPAPHLSPSAHDVACGEDMSVVVRSAVATRGLLDIIGDPAGGLQEGEGRLDDSGAGVGASDNNTQGTQVAVCASDDEIVSLRSGRQARKSTKKLGYDPLMTLVERAHAKRLASKRKSVDGNADLETKKRNKK